MIRFIQVEDTLPIRNEILRDGKLSLEQCRFPGDEDPESFHLGYFVDEKLVCIATFHPSGYKDFSGKAYQLRGMATLAAYQGKGIGNQLVNFAIVYLRGRQVNYLWCNGRVPAIKFYLSLGFEPVTAIFEIPGTGPHRVLYLKIQ